MTDDTTARLARPMVGVLAAIGGLDVERLRGVLLMGELSLGGEIQPIRGVLPRLEGARVGGIRTAVVPVGNAAEAGLVEGIQIYTAATLDQVIEHLLPILFHQHLDFVFGIAQRRLTVAGKFHAAFEHAQGLLETDVAAFHLLDQLLELAKRRFEGRRGGGFDVFSCHLSYRVRFRGTEFKRAEYLEAKRFKYSGSLLSWSRPPAFAGLKV